MVRLQYVSDRALRIFSMEAIIFEKFKVGVSASCGPMPGSRGATLGNEVIVGLVGYTLR